MTEEGLGAGDEFVERRVIEPFQHEDLTAPAPARHGKAVVEKKGKKQTSAAKKHRKR
ncbi:MAG: hypothetical protein WDN06_14000 [Asticcacaulis sp.]